MRKGMNPNRLGKITRKLPPDIPVIAIITHLPELTGWHKQRAEIVKACCLSARKNAGTDALLLVWDNGSCEEIRDWLYKVYKPDRLMLSENIGKVNALGRILRMFNDSIVAYSDDDILFYPDWLVKQLKVLGTYPSAVVTGVVTRHTMSGNNAATQAWAKVNAMITPDPAMSHDWDRQHGMSVGREANNAVGVVSKVTPQLVEYKGVTAYIGNGHCQMTARASDIVDIVQLSDMLMMPELPFDKRVDEKGILHLTTVERTARHMGNILLDEDREEIGRLVYAR